MCHCLLGAMSHGKIKVDYIDDLAVVSKYPLSLVLRTARICKPLETQRRSLSHGCVCQDDCKRKSRFRLLSSSPVAVSENAGPTLSCACNKKSIFFILNFCSRDNCSSPPVHHVAKQVE